jgi:2-polyprenyl-3-methyl-5-hydroxy-6-metoxy-1,4-benzoquinol methylase
MMMNFLLNSQTYINFEGGLILLKNKISLLAKRYQKFMSLTKIKSNKKIIDCASGRGFGSNFILQTFTPKKLVCIDISSSMIEECRMRTNGKADEYIQTDLRKFECDEQFDYFFSLETLEHLPKEDNMIISKRISNLIKVGGKLFISVPGNPKDCMKNPDHLQMVSEKVLVDMFDVFTLESKGRFIKRKKEPDSYNSLYVFIKKYN